MWADIFRNSHGPKAIADAHNNLTLWGVLIRKQFDLDNLWLTARVTHSEPSRLVAAIMGLGSMLQNITNQICNTFMSVSEVKRELSEVKRELSDIKRLLVSNTPVAPLEVPTPPHPPEVPTTPNLEVLATPNLDVSPTVHGSSWGTLARMGDTIESVSNSDKAHEVFLKCMVSHRGTVPPGVNKATRGRVTKTLLWFNAMASQKERALLLSAKMDIGDQRVTVQHIHDLVVAHIKHLYTAHSEKIPSAEGFKDNKNGPKVFLSLCSLENLEAAMKRKKIGFVVHHDIFQTFRKDYEAQQAQLATTL